MQVTTGKTQWGGCVPEVSVPGRRAPNTWIGAEKSEATSHDIVGVPVWVRRQPGEALLWVGNSPAPDSSQRLHSAFKWSVNASAYPYVSHVNSHQSAFGTEQAPNDQGARMTLPVCDFSHPGACTMGPGTLNQWRVGVDGYLSWRSCRMEGQFWGLFHRVGWRPGAHSGNQLINH